MKNARLNTQTRILDEKVIRFIWQGKAPKRVELIVWFLAMGKLKTGDILARANIITQEQATCPMCGVCQETNNHLFFKCKVPWQIWTLCFQWWGIQTVIHEQAVINILSWGSLVKGKFKRAIWNSMFFSVIWTIWFTRNKVVFDAKQLNVEEIMYNIKQRVGE